MKNFHEKLEEKVRMEHQLKEKVCILESQAGFGRPADVKVDLFTRCYLRLAWNPFFIVGVFLKYLSRKTGNNMKRSFPRFLEEDSITMLQIARFDRSTTSEFVLRK